MPIFLLLFIIGVLLLVGAYTLPMPPEVRAFARFGGIAFLFLGCVWLIWDLLPSGSLHG